MLSLDHDKTNLSIMVFLNAMIMFGVWRLIYFEIVKIRKIHEMSPDQKLKKLYK